MSGKPLAELKQTMGHVKIPECFVMNWEKNSYGDIVCVLRKQEDIELIFKQDGGGTTRFKVNGNWHTFDRRGVSDSFYWKTWNNKPLDPNALVIEQLEAVAKKREYHLTAVKIPDVGYTIAPNNVDALKAELRSKGIVIFSPSGFGTGYRLLRKQPNHPFGTRRANKELEQFFGLSPLWLESFDAD